MMYIPYTYMNICGCRSSKPRGVSRFFSTSFIYPNAHTTWRNREWYHGVTPVDGSGSAVIGPKIKITLCVFFSIRHSFHFSLVHSLSHSLALFRLARYDDDRRSGHDPNGTRQKCKFSHVHTCMYNVINDRRPHYTGIPIVRENQVPLSHVRVYEFYKQQLNTLK